MKTNLTNHALQLMLALAFPMVAIGVGLQSCSEDGPKIPSDDAIEEACQVKNLLMRSPEEAIDIAQRAWEDFYGDGASSASRSGRCVIDYGRPVEVVRGAKSRGGSGSDTLLYVVNFADDGGFAVIAAPRYADELLAVTSQGHYYPESQPDQENVPGFELWMENARAYAASFSLLPDTAIWSKVDTTQNIELPDSLRIKPDIPNHPDNPGIPAIPPVTRDTTKRADPNDPYSGLLQHKEWNDTTLKYVLDRQLPGSWGQGLERIGDLHTTPESYYFRNGLCGCVTVAIAQICAYYREPSRIYLIRPGVGQLYSLNWNMMVKHRAYPEIGLNIEYGDCNNEDVETSHMMIATFCKAIADRSDANISNSGTSISKKKALETLKSLISRDISSNWMKYSSDDYPIRGQLFLMRGESEEGGHEWVCDGTHCGKYDHYYAIRSNSNSQWEIQSKVSGKFLMVHYNWGWYGRDNGWFNQSVISAGGHTFKNFEYVRIV